jgi:hypothetical protein
MTKDDLVSKDTALKMAIYVIEAFGRGCDSNDYFMDISEAINACKEALEQPAWQRLTDDEINEIVRNVSDDMYPWKGNILIGKIIRAIEQALKEKNGKV